jgi:hypothetical protein
MFHKNLYQVAIDMAYSNNYDPAAIVDIFREYGDHLYNEYSQHHRVLWLLLRLRYSKSDYDGAMQQYIKTIGTKGISFSYIRILGILLTSYLGQTGTLEPSYVIKKFLDAQRIHNLTFYLEKLHEADMANANHTTLLLNCYTKLKDVEKLNEFIKVLSVIVMLSIASN